MADDAEAEKPRGNPWLRFDTRGGVIVWSIILLVAPFVAYGPLGAAMEDETAVCPHTAAGDPPGDTPAAPPAYPDGSSPPEHPFPASPGGAHHRGRLHCPPLARLDGVVRLPRRHQGHDLHQATQGNLSPLTSPPPRPALLPSPRQRTRARGGAARRARRARLRAQHGRRRTTRTR
jgi:hypothetical protein